MVFLWTMYHRINPMTFELAPGPRPVSRKTRAGGVKKSFLFEPKVSLKDFSRQA
jgi:hypothetical protein